MKKLLAVLEKLNLGATTLLFILYLNGVIDDSFAIKWMIFLLAYACFHLLYKVFTK